MEVGTKIKTKNCCWTLQRELDTKTLWSSDYYCSDGDSVGLIISKIGDNLEINCFSGIGASSVYIDSLDFGVFKCVPNEIEDLDFNESFEIQSCKIADYLCSKFCEKVKS